jgi:L-2-hydroxyglutarate oxidase LhgO
MNICIIGAGWFGCYIGHELIKRKYSVDIYEKENDIFLNASGNNQNRLHLGLSLSKVNITRKLSKTGFDIFKKNLQKIFKKN